MTTPKTQTLAEFVRQVRTANDWSLNDVVRQANDKISMGYLSMIENERIVSPSTAKLKALAKGLKVNPELLRDLVMGIEGELTPEERVLVAAFRQMDERAKHDMLSFAQNMRDTHPNKDAKATELPHQPTENHIGTSLKKSSTAHKEK